jgi:hypothetical protein
MSRIWRSGAARLLVLYLVLGVIGVVCASAANPALPVTSQAAWLPVAAFLVWRVSRGGRAARLILITESGLSFARAVHVGPSLWSPYVLALLAIDATQMALLVSPAVYQRTRPKAPPGPHVVTSMPLKPPVWMLLSALLAGLVVTLLFLGSINLTAIPGCGPAGTTMTYLPNGCLGLARGYPLPFLTAYQGVPELSQTALVMDWVQWSVVSFSAVYLMWLPGRRPRPLPGQPSAAREPSAA